MFKIELGGRLKVIAGMVNNCEVLCDVGTDHGYIPIYLVEKGIVKRAVASDVRPGPVAIAKNNIFQNNLEDKIETRLGDGLKTVDVGECDCAVIAGMGGLLIRDIIDLSIEIAKNMKQLVLQPMNGHEVLREYLYENGFDIVDEKLVREENKFYIVLSVLYTGTRKRILNKINFYIGEKLIENKDPLLPDYLRRQLGICNKILNEMNNTSNNDESSRNKYEWLKNSYESLLENPEII